MASSQRPPVPAFDATKSQWWPRNPEDDPECDVVMKGGITSGVIYPRAITEIAKTYRLRGVGGSSAGAIGAALGAAAEFGRKSGGFARLGALPTELDLTALFQPSPSTASLLPILNSITGFTASGTQRKGFARWAVVIGTIGGRFWPATLLGLAPGAALALFGGLAGGGAGWALLGAGILLALVFWVIAMAIWLSHKLIDSVPDNMFGICTGSSPREGELHLTDWLSAKIDDLAGLKEGQGPLLFGQLWTHGTTPRAVRPEDRRIDLQMVSTCLSRSRPYSLPLEARSFYYDPLEWRSLFQDDVLTAMRAGQTDADVVEWRGRTLYRFPEPARLPVIVATRMSLSFPLLISAVPLWTANYRTGPDNGLGVAPEMAALEPDGVVEEKTYDRLWFSDGGLSSNFPIHLFDSPLASRPTFGINLGRFAEKDLDEAPIDQDDNIVYAQNNSQEILPSYTPIADRGWKAVLSFAFAAFSTARDWQDNLQLPLPGNRDRIVRVLQTKTEGGLNLQMPTPVIEELAYRGEVAARRLVGQFRDNHYPPSAPTQSGWANHRWVRYRALLAGMPGFLEAYAKGKAELGDIENNPPSLPRLTKAATALAHEITGALDAAAIASADSPAARAKLTAAPRPITVIRRVPQI